MPERNRTDNHRGTHRDAAKLYERSRKESNKQGLKPKDADDVPVTKKDSWQRAFQHGSAAEYNYRELVDLLEKETQKLQAERETLTKKREPWLAQLQDLQSSLETQQQRLQLEEQHIEARRAELERETAAHTRLLNTLKEQSARLTQEATDAAARRETFVADVGKDLAALAQAREQHRERLDKLVDEFAHSLAEHATTAERSYGTGLASWSETLAKREGELQHERRRIDDDRRRLDAREVAIEAEINARVPERTREIEAASEHLGDELEHLGNELERAKARADQSEDRAHQLELEIQQLERDGALIEDMTPQEAIQSIRRQRETIAELTEQVKARVLPDDMERMGELLVANQRLHGELARLGSELAESREHAHALEHALRSEEQLASEVDTFKALNETYLNENAELRKALRGDGATLTSCFPRLTELDGELDGKPATTFPDAPPLDELARGLHAALAAGDERNPPLFYEPHDIRAFVAGLAMSRLHILEGDAGTGKTSLAVRAAQLLGGYVEKIDVQAGWRDSDRLIGTYNSFERRYEEEPFTVAVYRAGAAAHSDQIFVIVLDEMNLSAVEYYFADLSPKLEDAARTAAPIALELMTSSPDGGKDTWPKRLHRGRVLTVPPNVWFIGTANRDESTHTIADKTYDRSAILRLERAAPVSADGSPEAAALQVGFSSLQKRFEAARANDHPISQMTSLFRALERVDAALEPFSLRWSPRFRRQLEHFVPVYVACGGRVEDATDHLLATKVLRRLRDRYGNRRTQLEGLQDEMRHAWKVFGSEASPRRSLQALDTAMERAMLA